MKVGTVILAAGSGTRLNNGIPSEKPKVLYEICGKPMVAYTIDLLKEVGLEKIVMVVGYQAELVEETFAGQTDFVVQKERLGTAHAAKVGTEKIDESFDKLLVIQGDDSAFLKKETLGKFIDQAVNFKVSFTTVKLENPGAYGRVVRNESGEVVAVVEKEETNPEQEKINEVNAATYFVDRAWFEENYPKLQPSLVGKGEIIMPDLIKLAFSQNEKVLGFEIPEEEWVGVNTPEELERANKLMKEKQNG